MHIRELSHPRAQHVLHALPRPDKTERANLYSTPGAFAASYNAEPFGFSHNLHTLDMFQPDSLAGLCKLFSCSKRDFFVAQGAAEAGTPFYSVPHGDLTPDEALQQLESRPLRILLKRPENQDARFRALLNRLFRQVMELKGGMGNEKIVRLESAILITSAATITPLHFDPEIGFFSQVEGEKIYHVYSPSDTTESEMESFYIGGNVDIAPLAMETRHEQKENIFYLQPGTGMHQPQNAPHWVQTASSRSVSYTFVFETDKSRALGRTRAFNHYQRKLGITPSAPGEVPALDVGKSRVMQAVIPVRQRVGSALRHLHLR